MTSIGDIHSKVIAGVRISTEEALHLYHNATIGELAVLADSIRQRLNDNIVNFIRNIHIEPTNICRNRCRFCSYRKSKEEFGSYTLSEAEVLERIANAGDISEVHIVGGLNTELDLNYYLNLFQAISKHFPLLFRKGLTAEEIHFLCGNKPSNYADVLQKLKDSGLQSLAGGGAEIFKPEIRRVICPEKLSGEEWLLVHKTAHRLGLPTNATILYGHIESPEDRIDHLVQIRQLQDETHGFNAFIPLKYKLSANSLGIKSEVPLIDDLRMFAISRIFLDNIPHIKAYWPMLGFENALLLLSFGADDLDGTISQSTGIYQNTGNIGKFGLTAEQLVDAIRRENKIPVERDSNYREIRRY